MSRITPTLISAALLKSRPASIYINAEARFQWYADISAIADMLRANVRGFHKQAQQFFDDCGVPR